MIPKVLHLYWGCNNPLSFLRYMTVVSFSTLNPEWKIIVHHPIDPHQGITWNSREHQIDISNVTDYFSALSNISNCEMRSVDLSSIKFAEIIRSDLMRWKLLAEQGGWWSDFDILFIRSMFNLNVDDSVCVVGVNQHTKSGRKLESIGFLGSDAGDFAKDFFENVLHNAQIGCNPKEYQSAGCRAYAPIQNKWLDDKRLCLLPTAVVYPIQSWEAKLLYLRTHRPINSTTIGIHWFGGFDQSQKFERAVDRNTIQAQRSWFADMLKSSLSQVSV